MKYKKIKTLNQYNEYCNIHEELMFKNEMKYQDELELLEILIEDYDRRLMKDQYKKLNPVELLRSLLINGNYTQIEFAKAIGISPQLVSDILNYRRGISKDLIIKLSSFFSISQEAFNRTYELNLNKKSKQKTPINTE